MKRVILKQNLILNSKRSTILTYKIKVIRIWFPS